MSSRNDRDNYSDEYSHPGKAWDHELVNCSFHKGSFPKARGQWLGNLLLHSVPCRPCLLRHLLLRIINSEGQACSLERGSTEGPLTFSVCFKLSELPDNVLIYEGLPPLYIVCTLDLFIPWYHLAAHLNCHCILGCKKLEKTLKSLLFTILLLGRGRWHLFFIETLTVITGNILSAVILALTFDWAVSCVDFFLFFF